MTEDVRSGSVRMLDVALSQDSLSAADLTVCLPLPAART